MVLIAAEIALIRRIHRTRRGLRRTAMSKSEIFFAENLERRGYIEEQRINGQGRFLMTMYGLGAVHGDMQANGEYQR